VIVPTLNEEQGIEATLASIPRTPGDEIIVVDGGSMDDTVAIAQRSCAEVLHSPAGRALQMNCGAEHARGEVLLFLHADTLLPQGGIAAVRAAMQQPHVVGGAFRLAFFPSTPGLRLIAWGTNMRTRFGKLPYGDQALFVRRTLFEALGGYTEVPLLEDVKLVQALRRQGELALLDHTVHTSGRRWLQRGLVTTTLRNTLIIAFYFCGVSPGTLKRWYT
jgi:rSAM/selenodomain-associated transferase 2